MKADFGIFGGDGRNLYLAAELCNMGYRVIAYGMPRSWKSLSAIPVPEHFETAATLKELVQGAKTLVGPLPFSKYVAGVDYKSGAKGKEAKIEETDGFLSGREILENLQEGQILYAGGIPASFEEKARKKGVACKDFLKEETFLKANAWMTAEGCMAELFAAWPGIIRDANILVAGYGSCGSAIAELLLQAGATITVCVRSTASAWKAYEKGCKICYYEGLGERLAMQDIIINTVPARVFGEAQLKEIRPGTLLVEIASAPGGFCKEAAKESGAIVVDCPGLPGKYSPAGAAKAMAEMITAAGAGCLPAPEQRAKQGG